MSGITAAYEVLRHPDGGRRDVLRWTAAADQASVARIEIERPGAESALVDPKSVAPSGLGQFGIVEVQIAGQIGSKFGRVHLLSLFDATGQTVPCLGFIKDFADPRLRLNGWSCQGETVAARRAAIACTLNRLMLLNAGNDAKLAELFAHAELRRTDCSTGAGALPESADWIAGTQSPPLRGAL